MVVLASASDREERPPMAGSRRSADPCPPVRWRGGTLAGALGVAALALVGCGTVVAPAAQSSGVSGSGQPSAAPSQPTPASQLLCASPAAVSRVAIAQTPYPRLILPAQPAQHSKPGLSAEPAQPPVAAQPPVTAQPAPSAKPVPSAMPVASAPPVPSTRPGGTVAPRPPIVKIVTSAPRSRALARAVCNLPGFPRGRVNCPALFTGVYQLTFTADGRQLTTVTIQDAGCQAVTGAGVTRTASGQSAFWTLLTKTAGPAVRWPWWHLPGPPAGPGGPVCGPPSTRTPPGAPKRFCPGPIHPVAHPVAAKLP
jgi:hypothetical protein